MRALRKIIFINSAHIRYAEVSIDGNVHFIGTQGVGKSTLLRAILFFYNADKLHLGIPREMKPFDEFYLPYPNSYIAYEVEHEHGVYSILVNRSSYGRASYRFIDSPFLKEWLIDDQGEVTADQKTLNSRIGKLPWRRVEDYSKYRDIIYGNTQSVGKDFARYQLIEARRYQNIYRSIQNVFLNSRLDAEFIKDIIIRSMHDEEAFINLAYYRNQVADFEQEYNDISCWYRTDKDGRSTVRIQAENVIKAYRELLYLAEQIQTLCGEFNYARRRSIDDIPAYDDKINKCNEALDRMLRLCAELKTKHQTERSKLDQNIGVAEDTLRRCKERAAYYAGIGIDEIMRRSALEDALKHKLEALRQRLLDLTAKFDDITTKYRALTAGVQDEYNTYVNTQQQILNQQMRKTTDELDALATHRDNRKDELQTFFDDRIASDMQQIETIKLKQTDCEKSLIALRSFAPYAEQIHELDEQLSDCRGKQDALKAQIKQTDAEISLIQAEYDKEEARLAEKAKEDIDKKQDTISKCQAEIEDIDSLLAKTDGSLYKWLSDNMPGWENNIGRVVDEKSVLYNDSLDPRKASRSDANLYGVELDLSALPLSVRKPDQLKARKDELLALITDTNAECEAIHAQKNADIDALKKKYASPRKKLKEALALLEGEAGILPNKIKALTVKREDLIHKTNDQKTERNNAINQQLNELAHQLLTANEKHDKTIAERDRQIKAVINEYKAAKKEAELRRKDCEQQTNERIAEKAREKDAQIERLKQQELAELAGKGADHNAVSECNIQIEATEAELKYIDQHKQQRFDYLKDKKELFDREDETRAQLKLLRSKRDSLVEKYNIRQKEYDVKIAHQKEEINSLSEKKKMLEQYLQEAERFVSDGELCPPSLPDAKERKTISTLHEVIEQMKKCIYSRQTKTNHLKEAINVFKGNFSAKNTFKFRTLLNTDADYMDFASNLDDFMQNDKIEQYRVRVKDRYIEILSRVSKEMGDLTNYESEINRIVNDINNDFQEKNFVGVIKLIALRMRESSDQMVQLMKRIKAFHDEYREDLGALNLFSTDRRDDANRRAVDYILEFMKALNQNAAKQQITLSALFQLDFRVVENDNDTGWVSKLSHVGSEGTDTLVKAMVNIMLINVFKEKLSKRSAGFQVHCMMDEIGKLHPQNVKGILEFANTRNIWLINSSPTTYNVSDYRYTYLLDKDSRAYTVIHPLILQS